MDHLCNKTVLKCWQLVVNRYLFDHGPNHLPNSTERPFRKRWLHLDSMVKLKNNLKSGPIAAWIVRLKSKSRLSGKPSNRDQRIAISDIYSYTKYSKMQKTIKPLMISMVLLCSFTSFAQEIAPEFSQKMWQAQWVQVPDTDGKDYGVYLFRKQIEIEKIPSALPVYISADNKYELYVNEALVSRGPNKGDLSHWNFEILDLAAFLKKGKNTVAAKIWNEGSHRQEAQLSFNTGFILQGASPETAVLNTDSSWKCVQDTSYSPILISDYMPRPGLLLLPGYYVAGPGEKVDMSKKYVGWKTDSFDDGKWKNAQFISPGIPRNTVGLDAGNSWRLVPSTLPPMETVAQRFKKLRKADGVTISPDFPEKSAAIEIPANISASLLLDQTYLTNAYPTLTFSGGKKSIISLTYAEALYDAQSSKGDRNKIDGKTMIGRTDSLLSSGAQKQEFTPISYRTYRYLEVTIKTEDDPLVIDDISSVAVGYPFKMNATLKTSIPEMDQMMDIGWRTAKLCAMDTYMDCPYWEQLQYIGDTRIQAMVSLYNSGDDQLVKHALDLIDFSRQPEGITLSRYPTQNAQIITPFSLWYIGMLYDYMMYGNDRDFIKNKLSGTRQILEYFEGFQEADGGLKTLPGWTFTDWVDDWQRGMPPFGNDGSSALLDLQLLMAYRNAKELEEELGMEAFASAYQTKIEQLSGTIQSKYWDEANQLFADTKDKDKFSQHTNSLAILTGLVTGTRATEIGKQIVDNITLTPASIYFRYYVHQALVKAGLGDDYLDWLDIWRTHIAAGLTTWAEDTNADTTRSDCHAWGSSPNIEFFRTILGIDSAAPHFRTVRIEPRLGEIKKISGEIPHPEGKIKVDYLVSKKGLEAEISLPEGISGQFVWKGNHTPLKAGLNTIKQ